MRADKISAMGVRSLQAHLRAALERCAAQEKRLKEMSGLKDRIRCLEADLMQAHRQIQTSSTHNHWTWKERAGLAERSLARSDKEVIAVRAEMKALRKQQGPAGYVFVRSFDDGRPNS